MALFASSSSSRVVPAELSGAAAPSTRSARVVPSELVADCEEEQPLIAATKRRREVKDEDERVCSGWIRELEVFGRRNLWLDKAWLVVDRLQTLGILWVCSQAWPWPTIWLAWSRWSVAANADAPALRAGMGTTSGLDRSVYGELRGYATRVAAPIVGVAALAALADRALRSSRARRVSGRAGLLSSARVIGAAMATRAAIAAYAPCALAVARLFRCEYLPGRAGLRLSVDPALSCYSGSVFLARATLGPVALVFLAVLPRALARRARDACEFDDPTDHERALQALEIEHVLDVDGGDDTIAGRGESDYASGEAWLVAPFRRRAVSREARLLGRKIALAVASVALAGRAQGVAILGVVVAYGVPDLARPPYRAASTNAVLAATEIAAIATATYAALTAWGLRSATVMPKQQSAALLAVNGFAAAVVVFGIVFVSVARPAAARSLERATRLHGAASVREWLTTSRRARAAAARCRAWRPAACAPMNLLEREMASTRTCWLQAKRRASLLELVLRKSLDDLILAHQGASSALHLNRAWLPRDVFETLRAYQDARVLLRHRRLLIKLLALSAFLSSPICCHDGT